MKIARFIWASALAVIGLICGASAQREFPTFRAAPLSLVGEWEQAEYVVVGDVRNIRPLGIQQSVELSWPIPAGVYSIYWCEADFEVIETIKGPPLPRDRKFVWGSGVSGCVLPAAELPSTRAPFTRVWFLGHEDGYLRPVADYSATRFYYEIHTPWGSGPNPQARLAQLLLAPGVGGFPEPANLACSIVGETECVIRIRALASLGDPDLRREACDYLASWLHLPCEP